MNLELQSLALITRRSDLRPLTFSLWVGSLLARSHAHVTLLAFLRPLALILHFVFSRNLICRLVVPSLRSASLFLPKLTSICTYCTVHAPYGGEPGWLCVTLSEKMYGKYKKKIKRH